MTTIADLKTGAAAAAAGNANENGIQDLQIFSQNF